jgi:hypothetical protein
MLVCRSLNVAVFDEEAEYIVENKKLLHQIHNLESRLVAINEKLACFDDLMSEAIEARAQLA